VKHSICAVFDIDDTLYLERDYVRSGFQAAGAWAARWLDIDEFGERCWCRFQTGHRQSVFDEVLREAGYEPVPSLVGALVEIYRTHAPAIALCPDAESALRSISEVGSVAVITDGPAASQARKAEALGLSAHARPIVLTDIFGTEFRKPHPRAFEHVMHCQPAGRYIYIADNPAKDFTAPRQLGWFTVRVRRPGGLHSEAPNLAVTPDLEVIDCSPLPKLITKGYIRF
jgi:putative hydrolase of the HAD superfamily